MYLPQLGLNRPLFDWAVMSVFKSCLNILELRPVRILAYLILFLGHPTEGVSTLVRSTNRFC